ncbi:YjiH family protein [Spiractinospora alimapuensis]|uniref:YjiH family protein n=1 Tax=Spiractinospora alimapuensis TaxID=2820884 RepID=UPI001F3B46BA|nr:YjiH family protein [Spiractinospora alimapuensis]QVQ51847.1 YjiH family protein [Spiractinospora alimapuensis]
MPERSESPPATEVPAARGRVRFVTATLVGLVFFLLPIPVGGKWTILFDVIVSGITDGFPTAVRYFALVVVIASAVLTLAAALQRRGRLRVGRFDLSLFGTGPLLTVVRLVGAALAVMIVFEVGPAAVLADGVGPMIFSTVVVSVAVIVPIGAVFVSLLVSYGGLEFLGTFARPIMRPVFRVPGRGALDALASFVGSYSVGLYVTNRMYVEGQYSAREAVILATCFSGVSLGFFAVVTATLDLMPYFPVVVGSVLFVCLALSAILARIPPLSRVRDDYVTDPQPESAPEGGLARAAVTRAVERARTADTIGRESVRACAEGLRLAIVILPTILAIGTVAVLIAEHTPLFTWLGRPLEPVIALLGIPDADTVAPASLIGISEVFLPALLSTELAIQARFFVAVLSLSQILFLSATIPLLLELDIPIRLRDCLVLFLLRTLIAIPIIAAITHVVFLLA